jgi:hypothetical protein
MAAPDVNAAHCIGTRYRWDNIGSLPWDLILSISTPASLITECDANAIRYHRLGILIESG